MDNNAPNYASWVPEAGGYVANGKVVSKSPMYDEAGKLRIDVDTSVFGGNSGAVSQSTGRNAAPVSQEVAVTNNPLQNVGITTANVQGSGEDANAMATGIGSLESMNNNTENTVFGPINTPATESHVANTKPLSPLEESQRRYEQYVATNNIQGQINELTTQSNLTGVDYTAQIQELTRQRQQKIENIDNNYASQISTAMMRGDTTEAERLRQEQANWRNSVGYQDAMANKYEQAKQDIDTDYQISFWDGVKDIAGMVAQALPGILNFQYDPMQDQNLLRAQSLIEMRARNRMSQTGMYYSTTTQYAISQACANLIPLYEKMAREEAIQNFQLLQQTASFLVDLEQAQFNLWKGQLDVKFQANAEKRKDIEMAWDRVNQLGYVDNEASAILNIPAGTESYATRKAYADLLNKVDAEERGLQQSKILSDYEQQLALQKMQAQTELNKDYWAFQAANPKTPSTSSASDSLTYAQLKETLKNYIKSGASQDEVIKMAQDLGANSADISAAVMNAYADVEEDAKKDEDDKATGGRTIDQKQTDLNEMMGTSKPSAVLKEAIRYSNGNEDTLQTLLNAVKYPKDDSTLSGKNVFNPQALKDMGAKAYGTYVDFMSDNRGTPSEVANASSNLISELDKLKSGNQITDDEYNNALIQFNEDVIQSIAKKAKEAYSSEDSGTTKEAVKKALNAIQTYSEAVVGGTAPNKKGIAADAYIKLITSIANQSSDNFDYNWLPGNTGDKSKIEAYANIASSVRDNKLYGETTSGRAVYDTVMNYLDMLISHDGLSAKDVLKTAWFAGY